MTKQQLLDQIKADIIEKNICPDLAKTATQLVFGDGNPEADIVFIGEAPGKNEDEQGIPFIGAAGKFLAEMLSTIHLKRNTARRTTEIHCPKRKRPSCRIYSSNLMLSSRCWSLC